MFSTAEIASLRLLDETTFDRLVSIISRTRVSDNAGGSTYTETTQTNVPCRRKASDAGEKESQFGGQLFSGLAWQFAFPVGTVITTDDEIVDGAERFAVMAVLGPISFETARIVLCIEK